MDDQRIGAAFRVVCVRRGWRQSDVARRAGLSASVVSLTEHGRLDWVTPATLRRVAAVLGIRVETTVRLPHGEVDRLLNAGHAALHEELARYLDNSAELAPRTRGLLRDLRRARGHRYPRVPPAHAVPAGDRAQDGTRRG